MCDGIIGLVLLLLYLGFKIEGIENNSQEEYKVLTLLVACKKGTNFRFHKTHLKHVIHNIPSNSMW